ncbi:NADH-quinone oxidoreductase subunit NuoN [Sutcliffiella horikoshii]|uniref:NADH-quinone oxidoreductase subunit NuoN n=1 Tax=Sutcliffiella horikoshii TaxID=79883 RepID=UPI001CBDC457|nr:NADH-quinone oxidoreductase subunit NuoN [Sutcliffiella horikoshii]UAL47206.1 NADH-quinone oxidoreductase subunit NuoN [Sutcliffiella horikoshii]
MDLETLLSFDWSVMAPEFIILGVATLLSLLDLFLPKKIDRRLLGWLGFASILVALGFLVGMYDKDPMQVTTILYETYRLDSFAMAFKTLILVGAAFVMLMAISYEPKEGLKEYRGEFFYLLLLGVLGAMIMSSSGDLITLFVGLELLSLASYVLAGLRKKNLQSNEAAMKYVINGGIATAITLFGMSYVYGLTGTTNLQEMWITLSQINARDMQYLLVIAFMMMFVGLSFKLATAPFHMWAPDVYQGAPTPVTAFLAVVSKTAGFIIVLRLFVTLFFPTRSAEGSSMLFSMGEFIAVLAVASMIIGNFVALRQRNVKRMFAYSGVAHAGYLLVPLATVNFIFIFEAMWFYLVAYLFMNIGALAVLQVVTAQDDSEDLSRFAGLYQRSPLLAVLMSVFLLSLAGIPGTAGFIGKLSIFVGAISEPTNAYVLASVLILTTVVSYFYYFGIMTQMFFRPAASQEKIHVPVGIWITVFVCALGTLLLGILPGLALDMFGSNFDILRDIFETDN